MNQEVKAAFEYALLARAAYAELDSTMSNLGTALTTARVGCNNRRALHHS
ncbi:MAG: hypothetical protein KDI39_16930 [Pseudomonadales bacterium]|nr:hypothetical protein [Pseudomonadales bacterium]